MSTKNKLKNTQTKIRFFDYLKGGKGFTPISINAFGGVINQWELFMKDDDFANFNKNKAVRFVEHLENRKTKTQAGKLSIQTRYNYLRRLKKFFGWLVKEPGYKSRINKNDIDFLRLSNKDVSIATQGSVGKTPPYTDIQDLIMSIEIENEIDMRDRALISLALITGMRISALSTLKMKSFDKNQKGFDQNPKDGVTTKNSKRIFTGFSPLTWKKPRKYFLEWYKFLEDNNYSDLDPIFPATKRLIKNNSTDLLITKNVWKGSGAARNIFITRSKKANIEYHHPHSYRHLITNIMTKTRLTLNEQRAFSMSLGHTNFGTTFNTNGYGGIAPEDVIDIMESIQLNSLENDTNTLFELKKMIDTALDNQQ